MKDNSIIYKISRYLINTNEDKKIGEILKIANFENIRNKKTIKNNKIIFVIPPMILGSGGLTSILRIASRLSKVGFEVFFTCYQYDDIKNMEEISLKNLPDYNTKFIEFNKAQNNVFEYVIACNWQAVYYSKSIKGYKIFFSQDFEPYFYNYSDNYFLAKKAYEMGFHIISLGKWNVDQIKKNCNCIKNTKFDIIEFPFEAKEYKYSKRNFKEYKNKRNIKIAVYIKREKKRIPALIMALLKQVYLLLKEKNINLDIYYFGLNPKEKVDIGHNLGRLNKKELANLYLKCDFGLVASMTNISLVPYEMIGIGLPVIEFKEGTYSYFLESNSAILIDFNPNTLVNKITYYLNHYEELEKMSKIAYSNIKQLSWDKTTNQFIDILKNIKGENNFERE